jgi:hypothetical protein
MKKEKCEVSWWNCLICLSGQGEWKFLKEEMALKYEIEGHLVCEISLCPESYDCDEKECHFHSTPEKMLEKLVEIAKQPWASDRVVADLVRSLEGYLAAVERETREWLEAEEQVKLDERLERQEEREKKLAVS